jgi:redox-sensitive bicupin YhaK (pirin superfamily)
MITVRKAFDRGHSRLPWLDSRHPFSFGNYRDRAHDKVLQAGDGARPERDIPAILIRYQPSETLLFDLP